MTTTAEDLATIGDLARALDEPVSKVQYVIVSRRIKPLRRCGTLRMFDRKIALPLIRRELRRIASRRLDPQPAA